MKWIQIIIFSFLLSLPTIGYGTIVLHGNDTNIQKEATISKKEKPKKKWRKWLKRNKGSAIYGVVCTASIVLIILGIIRKIRWMWMLGLFGILAPLIFGLLLGILMLIFGGRQRPLPIPEYTPEEKPQPKKDSK